MKRLPGKLVTTLSLSAIAIAALVLAAHVSLARQSSSQAAKMPVCDGARAGRNSFCGRARAL